MVDACLLLACEGPWKLECQKAAQEMSHESLRPFPKLDLLCLFETLPMKRYKVG